MSATEIIGFIAGIGLLVFLFYAMLFPEKL
ncbi:MAG: potassium-transporting ATPase subunit F [Acidimicrobiales bacterium]